jgi:hypothetical protein
MQEGNKAADSQHNRPIATRCGDDPMHRVQLHDSCADWTVQCRSMSLNARCAKSVLKWISQSMRNETRSVVEKT